MSEVHDTGAGGGLLFNFTYVPDSVGLLHAPRRYQRAEVAYGEASICSALVADVRENPDGDGWVLSINVGPEAAQAVTAELEAERVVMVRVIG